MRKYLVLVFAILFGSICKSQLTAIQIDSLVELTLKTFNVPGISVGIVKDGKLIHAKGYGVRSLATNEKADESTRYGIASNSKAFTAAALGILIDEGKLSWDDKVVKFIPDFKVYDPYVTREFTVRDLLTHRSGLGLGAGDLMFFPDSSDFTIPDIIHNLRYLKAVSGFRTKYDYDNLLYIVAGEVVKKVSGISWEEFIETKIMVPVGMTNSATNFSRLKSKDNVIDPHAPINGKVSVIKRDFSATANAAGGIYSNITDMAKWITVQLNDGKLENGKQLFSKKVHDEMWSAQTIIHPNGGPPYNSHFAAYGLGWFLTDVKGYKEVTHTGGLSGIVTQVTLIPELKLGIMVFTNQQSGAAFVSITNSIKDGYLGVTGTDWVKMLKGWVDGSEANAKKITDDIWKEIKTQQDSTGTKSNINPFLGTYSDQWFGDAVISIKNGKPWMHFKRSPRLTGELLPYKGTTFIVKWRDRSFDADCYVEFKDKTMISMKPISPLTDFSYDFQDLELKKK